MLNAMMAEYLPELITLYAPSGCCVFQITCASLSICSMLGLATSHLDIPLRVTSIFWMVTLLSQAVCNGALCSLWVFGLIPWVFIMMLALLWPSK
mmetsp:Transcript_94960/g.168657  ORF Transcript_94960/g.168657 Transcript_94960/m.168657 type:complete len:95 (+) Transcript_94960:121-405(+)